MANTFITPSLIARTGLATLYNSTVLVPLVWRDFDPDFTGKQGAAVSVRKPATFEAKEFNRSSGIELQTVTEDYATVTLDTIADVSFAVTAEEMTLEIEDFQEQLLNPAMEAISQKVDGDLAEALVDAAESVGGGGTVAMGAGDPHEAIVDARTVLGRNKIPTNDRATVLSPEAAGEALKDDTFLHADKSGSTDALREAAIGRVFGFGTYETQQLGKGAGDRGQADGIAFQRQAVVLATRALERPKGLPSDQTAVASYRGLTLRTTYAYNHSKKQDEVSIDLLYGIDTLRKEAAVQLNLGLGS